MFDGILIGTFVNQVLKTECIDEYLTFSLPDKDSYENLKKKGPNTAIIIKHKYKSQIVIV